MVAGPLLALPEFYLAMMVALEQQKFAQRVAHISDPPPSCASSKSYRSRPSSVLHCPSVAHGGENVPDNAAGPGNERTFPAPFEFS